MNWISNFVRPKIRALVQKTEVPENLWQKCDACGAMIFHRELEASHRVCPHCSHHMRIGALERLASCGADEGLVKIAQQCLLAAPAARPRNAGVLAEAIQDWSEGQDERARAAQIEAAEARVASTCNGCAFLGRGCTGYPIAESEVSFLDRRTNGQLECSVVKPLLLYLEKKLTEGGVFDELGQVTPAMRAAQEVRHGA